MLPPSSRFLRIWLAPTSEFVWLKRNYFADFGYNTCKHALSRYVPANHNIFADSFDFDLFKLVAIDKFIDSLTSHGRSGLFASDNDRGQKSDYFVYQSIIKKRAQQNTAGLHQNTGNLSFTQHFEQL